MYNTCFLSLVTVRTDVWFGVYENSWKWKCISQNCSRVRKLDIRLQIPPINIYILLFLDIYPIIILRNHFYIPLPHPNPFFVPEVDEQQPATIVIGWNIAHMQEYNTLVLCLLHCVHILYTRYVTCFSVLMCWNF